MGLFKELVPLLCSLQLQFLRTFSNVEERVNLATYHMFIRVTPFNIKNILQRSYEPARLQTYSILFGSQGTKRAHFSEGLCILKLMGPEVSIQQTPKLA